MHALLIATWIAATPTSCWPLVPDDPIDISIEARQPASAGARGLHVGLAALVLGGVLLIARRRSVAKPERGGGFGNGGGVGGFSGGGFGGGR